MAAHRQPRLRPTVRRALEGAHTAYVSAASTWELAIKAMLGKLDLPDELEDHLAAAGLVELPVTVAHTLAVRELAGFAHHDPFDRLLLAQARA